MKGTASARGEFGECVRWRCRVALTCMLGCVLQWDVVGRCHRYRNRKEKELSVPNTMNNFIKIFISREVCVRACVCVECPLAATSVCVCEGVLRGRREESRTQKTKNGN